MIGVLIHHKTPKKNFRKKMSKDIKAFGIYISPIGKGPILFILLKSTTYRD